MYVEQEMYSANGGIYEIIFIEKIGVMKRLCEFWVLLHLGLEVS